MKSAAPQAITIHAFKNKLRIIIHETRFVRDDRFTRLAWRLFQFHCLEPESPFHCLHCRELAVCMKSVAPQAITIHAFKKRLRLMIHETHFVRLIIARFWHGVYFNSTALNLKAHSTASTAVNWPCA